MLKIKSVAKRILHPFLYRWALRRSRKQQTVNIDGISFEVFPEVFHPLHFGSSQIFYNYLKHLQLENLHVLDMGAGSGILSFLSSRKGAEVVASDINPSAIEGLKLNAAHLGMNMAVIQSDLFSSIPVQVFDKIIVNPPYYRGKAESDWQHAFYAGQDLEYFDRLFAEARSYLKPSGVILMILSRDLDTSTIVGKATSHAFRHQVVESKRVYWEWFDIYRFSIDLDVGGSNSAPED